MSNYKTIDTERLAEMFKALSNPNRLHIFLRMLDLCPPEGKEYCCEEALQCCVGELGESIDVAPSTLSHHVKELRRAGLIRMERSGKNIKCSLNTEALKFIQSFLSPQQGNSLNENGA